MPGQVFYDASRKLILKGVDGVIFVADSQIERIEANHRVASRTCARTWPSRATRSTSSRTSSSTTSATCPNVAAVEELRQLLNPTTVPDFEAVARTGVGVFDTLKAVAKLVLTELRKGST